MNSLQRRLQVGLAASVVVLMALLWWLVGNAIEKFGEHFVQTRLMHDADNLLSALHVDPEGVLQITPGRMATIYQQPFSGHYFALLIGERVVYSRSLWDETLAVSPLAQGKTLQWRVAGPSGQPLLVWAGGFQKQGQQLVIAVAEDLTPLQASCSSTSFQSASTVPRHRARPSS